MFDISWGEMLLIGGAALIFIGPKELPGTLRALGQMTSKVRRMAGDFRSQFDEAMREADVQSIRKEFDQMNDAASSASSPASGFNPIQTIRDEIRSATLKPVDDKDRLSDLAPAAVEVAAVEPVADPYIPPPEIPAPVAPSSFDIAPAAPEPVIAAAPQPAPSPAGSIDASPPRKPRKGDA